MRPLPRTFYLRPTRAVAKDLLGTYLIRTTRGAPLVGKIVEVEAYLGKDDPASHAFRGRTKRNEVMFRDGGHLYVYFTYGMHFCANVVTGHAGVGHAVLIRAVEPVRGRAGMRRRRKGQWKPEELTNGPAKFCQAFGIGRKENGADLLGTTIRLARGEPVRRSQIVSTPRIGIRLAREKKWRYYIRGNAFVSRPSG
jgi:DNA-3-methyladenine glycosylase